MLLNVSKMFQSTSTDPTVLGVQYCIAFALFGIIMGQREWHDPEFGCSHEDGAITPRGSSWFFKGESATTHPQALFGLHRLYTLRIRARAVHGRGRTETPPKRSGEHGAEPNPICW